MKKHLWKLLIAAFAVTSAFTSHALVELSRKVEPENTQNITAAIFADGVERSGTESANFGGYAASPRAASRNCSGGSPSGFDVYTLKRL